MAWVEAQAQRKCSHMSAQILSCREVWLEELKPLHLQPLHVSCSLIAAAPCCLAVKIDSNTAKSLSSVMKDTWVWLKWNFGRKLITLLSGLEELRKRGTVVPKVSRLNQSPNCQHIISTADEVQGRGTWLGICTCPFQIRISGQKKEWKETWSFW